MKEKIGKGRKLKRLLSVVLAVAMLITLMPLNSITVYAAVHPNGNYIDGGYFDWANVNVTVGSDNKLQSISVDAWYNYDVATECNNRQYGFFLVDTSNDPLGAMLLLI